MLDLWVSASLFWILASLAPDFFVSLQNFLLPHSPSECTSRLWLRGSWKDGVLDGGSLRVGVRWWTSLEKGGRRCNAEASEYLGRRGGYVL